MSCWARITILWGGYGKRLLDQTRPKPGWSTCSFDSVSGTRIAMWLTLPQLINPFRQHIASFVCKWMNSPHLTVSLSSSSYRIFYPTILLPSVIEWIHHPALTQTYCLTATNGVHASAQNLDLPLTMRTNPDSTNQLLSIRLGWFIVVLCVGPDSGMN